MHAYFQQEMYDRNNSLSLFSALVSWLTQKTEQKESLSKKNSALFQKKNILKCNLRSDILLLPKRRRVFFVALIDCRLNVARVTQPQHEQGGVVCPFLERMDYMQ